MSKVENLSEGARVEPTPLHAPPDTHVFLVCVDGSELANKAFRKALSMKREGDRLYICHSTASLRLGKALCQHYVDECIKRKVEHCHQLIISSNNPKKDVLNFCDKHKVDTIFVGSRGIGKFKWMVRGSFSKYITTHSNCDVVLVK